MPKADHESTIAADGAEATEGGTTDEPPSHGGGLQYKVVELSQVTDEGLEHILNEWTARGWRFDGLQFAMRESSRRPAMAFVLFTRAAAASPGTD